MATSVEWVSWPWFGPRGSVRCTLLRRHARQLRHAHHVFAEDVDLDVDDVPLLHVFERGVFPRVGNDLNVEAPLVDAGDGEADAIDRDRPLPDNVWGEQRRELDSDPERL